MDFGPSAIVCARMEIDFDEGLPYFGGGDTDTDTDTDTGNVQSRTYAMGEAAIRDRARTTPDH